MASTAQQSSEQKEAIALRTQQKSPARPSKDRTTHPEEVNAVVDDARPLFSQNSNEGEELPKSDRTGAKFEERPTIVVAAAEDESAPASDEMGKNLETQVVALATAPEEAPAQPPETVQEIVCPKPSDNTSAADHQMITPAWDVLKQIRDAEGYVQLVESQIHELNSKLAKPSLDRIVERELKDVLKNRQNLRINKIS